MAQQSIAGLAVLVALAFAIMALNACASSEQRAQPIPVTKGNGTPEFHDASVGDDALRARLPSED
jgi:hypothetical protein